MIKTIELPEIVNRDGFAIAEDVVGAQEVSDLITALQKADKSEGVRKRVGVYAMRNLSENIPAVAELANAPSIRSLVEPILGKHSFLVRSILFDKTPEANWKVAWHQDLTIAVCGRIDTEGFGRWTQKAGVTHVQPPIKIMERMLAVRLHLDDCDETNGPLRVIPRSHLGGRLTVEGIRRWAEKRTEISCKVPSGGALLMKPLMLHASSAAKTAKHRRVIHLEFAGEKLPNGLRWELEAN